MLKNTCCEKEFLALKYTMTGNCMNFSFPLLYVLMHCLPANMLDVWNCFGYKSGLIVIEIFQKRIVIKNL